MVTARDHSARLHEHIPQSTFELLPGTGHMVHQTATGAALDAVNRVRIAT
jgi:pimeloyl-ACP methyl ester carboxylesterase